MPRVSRVGEYVLQLIEGFPDSDRAEAKRHNNTHSGEACDPFGAIP